MIDIEGIRDAAIAYVARRNEWCRRKGFWHDGECKRAYHLASEPIVRSWQLAAGVIRPGEPAQPDDDSCLTEGWSIPRQIPQPTRNESTQPATNTTEPGYE